MGFCGRFMTRSYGFHVMSVKGTQAPASEAPIIVVAPHSSFFDGLAGYWSKVPGLVSRIENSYIPCFGKFITYTQPVFVLRDDVSSRQQSINEIKKRVNSSDGWPQIMVFPEGTCTNRSCLITFKPGAFYPGVPVQPVVMRYLNSMDTTTWTWDGPGALKLIWLTMTQFHNFCQLEYLPVYYPNEEEKKDARLYAANVRAVMAKALGVPVVDYTYDDCRIMDKARKSKLPPCIGLIEFQKLRQKYGFTIKDVEKCMTAQFSGMADKDGLLRLPGLSRYLHLPATEPTLVHLFNLIDSNGKGAVSFREYLLGYWDIVKPIIKDEIVNIAFKQLDPDEKGKITRDDLTTVLNAIFFLSKKESDQIFDELDVNKNKIITYGKF
ncbi:hypothetical protein HAZT_HAZT008821 [Hyalella azteca]|uniref:EF-hand domain-containing protein n=1 Tax=Hyalella azteca TaxID=294128 RepID=A0A6A0HAL9_HYAAZ|nr:hypothetical protein HAZT_HAZT008821 [Hyalella azteca]